MNTRVTSTTGFRLEDRSGDHPERLDTLRMAAGCFTSEPGGADPVDGLVNAAKLQGLSLDPVLGILRGDELIAAAVALCSPGRTALVLDGSGEMATIEATSVLLGALQESARRRGVSVLHGLLPPGDEASARAYRDAGFSYLTELAYLTRTASGGRPSVGSHSHTSHVPYSAEWDDAFVQTLDATYRASLDCPGLVGLRPTRDVLIGHRHTGIVDPSRHWFLAVVNQVPVGLLLLSEVIGHSALEVVYLGVVEEARGRGVADGLLALALDVARKRSKPIVTLAVDATNTYARRLYDRWGFEENSRRRAWICGPRRE